MEKEKYSASNSIETSNNDVDFQIDKNKKINELVKNFADLGAVDLVEVPVDEYQGAFYTAFAHENDQDYLGDERKRFEQPVYSDDGSEIVAYQVYAYADIANFTEEQRERYDELNTQAVELANSSYEQ